MKKRSLRSKSYEFNKLLFAILIMILMLTVFNLVLFSKTRVEAAESPATKCFTSITVREGDTLTSIANTYIDDHYSNVSSYIDEVKQMNHLTGDTIHAGEHITVPYYVEDDI